jgi:predicted ABC-type ATPase
MIHCPLLVILAGPNGAGKSTIASHVLQGGYSVDYFVNADEIARGLSPFHPEDVAIEAGRQLIDRVQQLSVRRVSFAVETTLAGRSHERWMRKLTAAGYRLALLFVWPRSVELCIRRVRQRAAAGGHSIPDEVVVRRFRRGLVNFSRISRELADDWAVYDNGDVAGPRVLAAGIGNRTIEVAHHELWQLFLSQMNPIA